MKAGEDKASRALHPHFARAQTGKPEVAVLGGLGYNVDSEGH